MAVKRVGRKWHSLCHDDEEGGPPPLWAAGLVDTSKARRLMEED